jgi:hypothetical protein
MNNNTTSEKLTFLELIDKYKIEIPIIQRDFAQGRDGKEELRKNFLNSLRESIEGKPLELDFVYGDVEKNVLKPLDGQQRLTTLFLLHWYIALKESKLDKDLKNLLSKFTYETRMSSREFCIGLINQGIEYKKLLETDYHDKEKTKPKYNELSKTIIDSSWFFLSWKRDPTIKSMLSMLDVIYQTLKDKSEVWDKLKNISFHFIELQNFGLSDDLYIKMNARGKALTDFENFKAKFEQYLKQVIYKTDDKGDEIHINGEKILLKDHWEKDLILNEENKDFWLLTQKTFAHKIDTVWTDFFWNYKNEKNIIDEQFLNFFRTFAVINYSIKSNSKNNFRENVDLLRSNETISFNNYFELECLDENYFNTLKSVLNKIASKSGLKKYLNDLTYTDEEKIFKGVIKQIEIQDNNNLIKNELTYPDLVIAFAYYQYLAKEDDVNVENFNNWMRIVRNLVEAHRLYYDNANTFADSLLFFSNLINHRNNIIEYFKDFVNTKDKAFPEFIIEEEKLKAKLISESDNWKIAIIEIENHGYFNGQIGFLLDWCKNEDGTRNILKFNEYSNKIKAIFHSEGLVSFENYLFERALLATGDYLLKKSSNHSFLIDFERDISWKRLLRDDNKNRRILKTLIDKLSIYSLIYDLQKTVEDFTDTSDWRYYFIKQREIIDACGKQKLIRKNSESDILLLQSTMTSGYHSEYYSYSLYIELKNKLSTFLENSYKVQKSVDYWKYFEINNRQIAFDCNKNKFVHTQNEVWENIIEFENRDDAVLEFTI